MSRGRYQTLFRKKKYLRESVGETAYVQRRKAGTLRSNWNTPLENIRHIPINGIKNGIVDESTMPHHNDYEAILNGRCNFYVWCG